MTSAEYVKEQLTHHQRRVERLRALLSEQNLDGVLVTNPENRRYLSGFTGHDSGADSAGALLVTHNEMTLITDGRYKEQAAAECPSLPVVQRQGEFAPVAAEVISDSGARRVGFEASHVTVALRDALADALTKRAKDQGVEASELVSTQRLIEPLREIKDALEIDAVEHAMNIADETFTYICGWLRPGMTERHVAQEIERHMVELGAEGLAFPSIVASGPNAALPHAIPSDRTIGVGEPITIDMGARYDGYNSDMTRTICIGEAGAQGDAVYDAVLRAQETCERGLHPGITGKEADALARDVLVEAGYGEQYLHSTGHGVGLEIHEGPRISRFAEGQTLEPGMIITVEPGVYISGWGGVRIEDTAVVTENGIRVLTKSHKRFNLPLR